MTLIVDVRHWLEDGEIPSIDRRLRTNVLRMARFIEAAGPIPALHGRETLVECTKRPSRRPCPGLMWVRKGADARIEAYCIVCGEVEAVIAGWQETDWAEGPMEPISVPREERGSE